MEFAKNKLKPIHHANVADDIITKINVKNNKKETGIKRNNVGQYLQNSLSYFSFQKISFII